jgi:hypothetical protein
MMNNVAIIVYRNKPMRVDVCLDKIAKSLDVFSALG